MELVEQSGDGACADPDAQPPYLAGDLGRGFVRPLQAAHRIAGCVVFQQPFDLRDYLGRFFSTGLRPAPGLRTRSHCTSCARSCWRPRATVRGSNWSNAASFRSPPRPNFSDSRPAYKRRWRSSSRLENRTSDAFNSSGETAAEALPGISERACRASNWRRRKDASWEQYKTAAEALPGISERACRASNWRRRKDASWEQYKTAAEALPGI